MTDSDSDFDIGHDRSDVAGSGYARAVEKTEQQTLQQVRLATGDILLLLLIMVAFVISGTLFPII